MARGTRKKSRTPDTQVGPSGAPLAALAGRWKSSVRGICRDLIGTHSTEIAYQIRNGMMSSNKKTALKYLMFVTGYSEGKPVEINRMPALDTGVAAAFDITKLSEGNQKKLLALLKEAKQVGFKNDGEA
jgi:hypothetical protein